MSDLAISNLTARRYLLGRQGLWPGRRWTGKEGAAEAIHALEALQLDPVTIVARSHDLVLWSRVEGYRPHYLDELMHVERRFFDYGGHLDTYPIEEFPYWRLHMRRRAADPRWAEFASTYADLLDQVRAELRDRGPLGNRDLAGNSRVNSYRARKDTGLALYYLWTIGELVSHSRRRFERVYYFADELVPPQYLREAPVDEVERYFAAKAVRQLGLATGRAWASFVAYPLHRRIDRTEAAAWLERLIADGEAAATWVEGQKEVYYFPASDLPLMEDLQAGRIPEAWRPLGSTTSEEVNLLSPLDPLLARNRTRALFGFEYLWEIYKPAPARRWGQYTMPVLWEDRLVARLDPKLDRKARVLAINGFWLEDTQPGSDEAFVAALAQGLARFAEFHEATEVNLAAIEPAALRRELERRLHLALKVA